MVNNNKILTVSYGTFSCTLEGFDDSFGTMKAIAEYFRDLASDDRYFGAEPPQPDAEMLTRIAQREVTRRVEAHSENGGIVLRANVEEDAATAITAPAAAATTAVAATTTVAKYQEAPVAAPQPPVIDDAAVKAAVDETTEDEAAPIDADNVPDEAPEAITQGQGPEAPAEIAKDVVAEDVDVEEVAAKEIPVAAEAEEMVATPQDVPESAQDSTIAAADSDSIAAKLQRIRAVVSRNEDAAQGDGFPEDEHADDLADDLIAVSPLTDNEDNDSDTIKEEPTHSDADQSIEAFYADSPAQNGFDDEYEAETPDPDANLFVEVEDENPLRARVIKVKRADLDAAIADGDLEEIMDETAETDASEDMLASSLSDTQEAELQRELADVEASLGIMPDEGADEPQSGARLLNEVTNTEEDMSRLMAETDAQMGETESSSRRDAFAHLRAAVAATKAEETLGTDDPDKDSSDAYRDDLASVVKPRRPESKGARTDRPADARPAPLKLVAEQRIDTDESRARGPVRPRRVASNNPDATAAGIDNESSGFDEFAAEMGTTELHDLLEAAASYMVFVEGRAQFSRPQLMNKIREVEHEDYSREYCLRSFGKLLRAGKIEKIKGGRFVVSDKIGFKPDPDYKRAVS